VYRLFSSRRRLEKLQRERQIRDLKELENRELLEARLAQMDRMHPLRRIYLMGCGRSGTWLLTALMTTFDDVEVISKEVPVEFFGLTSSTKSTLVLKRNNTAYRNIETILDRIELVHIIRHPFDVLTSHNPASGRKYHISPDRWLGEMLALRYLLESGRKNLTTIRYEDLVDDPSKVQLHLAEQLRLAIKHDPSKIDETFDASEKAARAMHGLRKIDRNSLGRYAADTNKLEHLRSISKRVEPMLPWVAHHFDYDVTLG